MAIGRGDSLLKTYVVRLAITATIGMWCVDCFGRLAWVTDRLSVILGRRSFSGGFFARWPCRRKVSHEQCSPRSDGRPRIQAFALAAPRRFVRALPPCAGGDGGDARRQPGDCRLQLHRFHVDWRARRGGRPAVGGERARPRVHSYFPLLPWLPWLAIMGASLAWVDHGGLPEVRDAVQLGMPVLVGVIAGQFVRTPQRMQQLVRAFYWSIPILWAFALLWFFTDLDQYWRTDMYVEKRALALTAILIGALAVAGGKREPILGSLVWFACFGITMITGSRTASLVMLMLPLFNPVSRDSRAKRWLCWRSPALCWSFT